MTVVIGYERREISRDIEIYRVREAAIWNSHREAASYREAETEIPKR
jgi:hypothetical protein